MNRHEANDFNLGLATGKVPPSWSIEQDREYPLRMYIRDLEIWAATTELPLIRQAPAVTMRITGSAKIVIREVPIATLQNGGMVDDGMGMGNLVQLNGMQWLIRMLQRRYAAAPQEIQIHTLSEFFAFHRENNESTDSLLARFEVALHRVENNAGAGIAFAPQIRAWLLLNHLKIPRTAWFQLLQPTAGMLPADDAEYQEFLAYVRRNGHLHDRTPQDVQKSISQPFYANESSQDQSHAYMTGPHEEQQEAKWSSASPPATTYAASTSTAKDDDLISWHSFSTGHSDDDEPVEWDVLDDVPEKYHGEHLYLAYRSAKRRWRAFAPKTNRFKGSGKGKGRGKGKGKGKHAPTYWTDDFGYHHMLPLPPRDQYADESAQVYFKGKGKGNPIGKDGKKMLCHGCDSDEHFFNKCPFKDSKGKGESKGKSRPPGTFITYLGPDIQAISPDASWTGFAVQDVPSTPISLQSMIHFSDGTPSISLGASSVASNSGIAPAYPWFDGAVYHANVRLTSGEALLIDTGAVGNLCGELQFQRMQALAMQYGQGSTKKPIKNMSVDGVGENSSKCSSQGTVPLALANGRPASYTAPLIDGSPIPALLGATSMTEQRTILDLVHNKYITVGPGGFEIKLSPGSFVLDIHRAPTGHLMLPCSEFEKLSPQQRSIAFQTFNPQEREQAIQAISAGPASSSAVPAVVQSM